MAMRLTESALPWVKSNTMQSGGAHNIKTYKNKKLRHNRYKANCQSFLVPRTRLELAHP